MKKFILFLSIVGVCFSYCVRAGELECSGDPGDPCGFYGPGGDVEMVWCLKNGKNFYNDVADGRDAAYKPRGTNCSDKDPAAVVAYCVDNTTAKEYTVNGRTQKWDVRSCSAKICEEGYALWLHRERDGTYTPWGRCVSYERIESHSKCTNCGRCAPDERCKVVLYNYTNDSYGVTEAYHDDRPCECQKMTCDELYPNDAQKRRECKCKEKYPDNEQKRICCEVGKEWDNVKNECLCEEGKKFDYQKRDCVEIPVEVQPPVNTDPCAQYSSNPEAYACCKKGLTWDAANKTCMCPEGYIWDKDKKDCVEIKEEPCNGVDCRKYYLDINLICPDGTRVYGHQYYKIDKNYLKEHGYDSFAEYEAANPVPCQDRIDHDVCMQELFCKGHEKPAASAPSGNLNTSNVPQQQSVVNKPDDKAAAVTRAKKVLDDFYTYAKDDKNRSVWKDSEGNFNTIRLASDLTAGVVLGTVGGVVSGVVIKKKQVEKGFDALHCTVGGQTVADWGDTFNVGLR